MTRKHFEAIARALRDARPYFTRGKFEQQWERDVNAIADACAAFNGGFKRDRFLRACGMGEEARGQTEAARRAFENTELVPLPKGSRR